MNFDYENMTPEECKLAGLYLKEGYFDKPYFGDGRVSVKIVSLPHELSKFYPTILGMMETENLCRHYRDMTVTECYESMEDAKKELQNRGYTITHGDTFISFKK